MAGRAYPNFAVIIDSDGLDEQLILHLKDVRIRVIPAGPNRRKNDHCIQVRGIIRASGNLEVRSNVAMSDTGMELGIATRLETNPHGGDEGRKQYVLNGGKAGRSRFTHKRLARLRKKNAEDT